MSEVVIVALIGFVGAVLAAWLARPQPHPPKPNTHSPTLLPAPVGQPTPQPALTKGEKMDGFDLDLDGADEDSGGVEAARRAYIVGEGARANPVHLLVKVHDYRGRAIYVYDLATGRCTQEADSDTPDIEARIARYREIGHPIKHPNNIPYSKAREWCAHARAEATRLGLGVVVQRHA